MRKIIKRDEPQEWRAYRQTHSKYQRQRALAAALFAEQGYVCAYCEGRITEERGKTRIDHLKPRSLYPERQMDYNNMVICCVGTNRGINGAEHCCDLRKRDREISFNLFEDDFFRTLRYTLAGEIHSSNPQWDNEISSVLNLNCSFLRRKRRLIYEGLYERTLAKNVSLETIKYLIKRQRAKHNTMVEGKYTPYSSCQLWYLEDIYKRLSKQ